ncbi:YadA-like family protein [Thiopseudomonas alkaliphila]|uniref:YadA-like family protein n=1 Tax=Thiopseudomonas alkaliphila TaxID=1697053 RepID=UPI0025772CF1|nr:YadA-like family protein [Thiopseudomonas alkaliphila]MDM1707187.1 YadA-like family protein [Thiopseudomonas alkaliphila]
MNKVFRVIWSEAQGAWVAVSETTKSHSKRSRKAALALALAAGGLLGVTGYASATSTGEIGTGSIAIGPAAAAAGACSATDAKGERSISIGCEAGTGAEGNNQTNLGFQAGADSDGNYNTALGSNTGENVKGDRNASLGKEAGKGVEGDDNAAFGSNAGETVKGNRNIGFGSSAGKGVQGNSNTSLGDGAGRSQRGDGNLSAGLSAGQSTYGDHNVMLGHKASTVGSTKSATINRTVVIGSEAKAHFDDTVALGSNAKAEHENSVALGHASQTAAAAQVDDAVIKTVVDGKTGTFTYSGFEGTASGVVSVGSAGAERQIINVAPGAITDKSTDAINGSQLFSVAKGINTDMYIQGNSVAEALGGGSKYEGGKVTADLTVGGKNYTNVQDALNNISTAGGWTLGSKDAAGAAQNLTVAAGGKVNLNAGKNMQVISEKEASGEITTTFATNDDVDFDSVTTAGAVMNADGISVAYDDGTGTGNIVTGPSMTKAGISAGNLKITNVQAGTADADGVNVSQLKGLGNVIGGVNIDNTTGAMTGPTFNVNQNSYTTINEAIAELDKGWKLSDGTSTKTIKADDTAVIKAGDNMDVTIDDVTGEMIVKTKDEVTFTTVTTGSTVMNNMGLQAGNTYVTNNGLTFAGSTVAVTGSGINAGSNKIANVEAGVADTDAVNVSQLKSVKDIADNANKGWNVSTNGGAANAANGGKTQNVAPDASVDFSGGKNIVVAQNGTDITISTADKVEFDDVKVGDVTINKDTGITVGDTTIDKDGVKVGDVAITTGGIHAGDNKITGVADGTIAAGSKDAVNGGQLYDMQVEIDKQAGGWELTDGQGGKQQVKAGDTVAIVGGDNINVEFDANGKMVVETTPDVTHNSVTTGDTVMNDNGVTIKDGPSITQNGVDAGDKKITNVAKGEISETSTDAINGSQLNETNNRVTKNEGDIKNIQNGKDGMFQVSQDYNAPAPKPTGTKSAAGGAGAVASGDNSTAIGNDAKATASNSTAIGNDAKATASNSTALGNSALASANNSVALGQGSVADRANSVSVGTVGGERQITNVAAGVAPTDAVNVSQLDALGSKVNQYFNAANKRIDKVDNNARAGIAAAMAAGTLPQSTLPGKSMVTVGASTYRGESALAIGVSRLSDNARTVIKFNASADSRGNAGAAVGAGWHW